MTRWIDFSIEAKRYFCSPFKNVKNYLHNKKQRVVQYRSCFHYSIISWFSEISMILKEILNPIANVCGCFFFIVNDSIISANNFNHDIDIINRWDHQREWSLILIPLSREMKSYLLAWNLHQNDQQQLFNGTVEDKRIITFRSYTWLKLII